jgi:hypothetical protein
MDPEDETRSGNDSSNMEPPQDEVNDAASDIAALSRAPTMRAVIADQY